MKRAWLPLVSFFIGLLLVPASVYLYLGLGRPPATVADQPFPFEKRIVRSILHKRIENEKPSQAAISLTPEALRNGVSIYKRDCSFCHGLPGHPSNYGKSMYPSAPQLWVSHRSGVVGVSDDPVGETYWRVKNGIRLTGMPSYGRLLSEDEMWQVSLLLSQAAKPLPTEVQSALSHD
jgi:mono/diheme cytochrome c family protein